MSSRITSLSYLTGSTATSSTFIWTVWNGKDYKVPLSDLGLYVGRSQGLCINHSVHANYTTGSTISWGNSVAFDSLGWYNPSTPHIITIPDDRVTHIGMIANFRFPGTARVLVALYQNATRATSPSIQGEANMPGSYPCLFNLTGGQLPVSSGDQLSIVMDFQSSTNTLEASGGTFWKVWPEVYK